MENSLLISIKTKYANQIFDGTKKYEYRRKSIGEKNLNKKIFVYSSEEEKAIVGYIIIDKILEGNMNYILKETDNIENIDIINYFKNCDKCYALKISRAVKFEKSIELEDIKLKKETFVIPQYFRYLKKDEYIYNELKKLLKINVETIKDYLTKEKFNNVIEEIYLLTSHLENVYPNYKNWFYEKLVKGCLNNERNIFFVRNEDKKIIAISILKKNENKICSLYVLEEYRNKGIGTILINRSFEFLNTEKPLITIPKDKIKFFQKFIKEYSWKLDREDEKEFYFNEK